MLKMQVDNCPHSTTICEEMNGCVQQIRIRTAVPSSSLLDNHVVEQFYEDKKVGDQSFKNCMQEHAVIVEEGKKVEDNLKILSCEGAKEMEMLENLKKKFGVLKKKEELLKDKIDDIIAENELKQAKTNEKKMMVFDGLKGFATKSSVIVQEYLTATAFSTEEQLHEEMMEITPKMKNIEYASDKIKIAIEEAAAEIDALCSHPNLLQMIYSSDQMLNDEATEQIMEE